MSGSRSAESEAELRHTARGLVLKNDQLLLMERWAYGKHYFSIPGGKIERDESAEEAVRREILEETSVRVQVGRPVLEMRVGPVTHRIFLCEYLTGEPQLPPDAPESLAGEADNFRPQWQPVKALDDLPLEYWEPLRRQLVNGLRDGFPQQVSIVSARASR